MKYLNIRDENIVPVVNELNQLLSDYQIYYQKLRNFHWNITGENFFTLHEKFESMYIDSRSKIDEIAERILTLQYHPISSYKKYLEVSSIEEESPYKSDKDMVEILLKDHRILLLQMNKVIKKSSEAKDEGTIDIISGYISDLEKTSWMLNAWSKHTKESYKENFILS
ncbi:Dps family protein [Pseudofulvibacter geojedonensis]|uniref:Dps family protein n=1 Tax=Pseudofulvibacter geojedonensis TaxID=1123758 RepID=A0ABW3I221_9FLAO